MSTAYAESTVSTPTKHQGRIFWGDRTLLLHDSQTDTDTFGVHYEGKPDVARMEQGILDRLYSNRSSLEESFRVSILDVDAFDKYMYVQIQYFKI